MIGKGEQLLIPPAVSVGKEGIAIPFGENIEKAAHLFRTVAVLAVEEPGEGSPIRSNLRRNHLAKAIVQRPGSDPVPNGGGDTDQLMALPSVPVAS
jgi:hypothetical protein